MDKKLLLSYVDTGLRVTLSMKYPLGPSGKDILFITNQSEELDINLYKWAIQDKKIQIEFISFTDWSNLRRKSSVYNSVSHLELLARIAYPQGKWRHQRNDYFAYTEDGLYKFEVNLEGKLSYTQRFIGFKLSKCNTISERVEIENIQGCIAYLIKEKYNVYNLFPEKE